MKRGSETRRRLGPALLAAALLLAVAGAFSAYLHPDNILGWSALLALCR